MDKYGSRETEDNTIGKNIDSGQELQSLGKYMIGGSKKINLTATTPDNMNHLKIIKSTSNGSPFNTNNTEKPPRQSKKSVDHTAPKELE